VYVLGVMLTIPACWQWTNSRTLSGLIQRTIYTVEVWCVEVGLSVNLEKMDLVVFTRKRNLLVYVNFTFCICLALFWVNQVYLRVILDSRQPWRDHMKTKVKKAQDSLWAYRTFYGATEGLKPCFIGCTSLSFGYPCTLHLWSGGLALGQLVTKRG